METKYEFYTKLSENGRKSYDAVEARKPHTNKFRYLLDHPTNEEYPHFGDADLEYLCKEDLYTVQCIFPDDAERYMSW